MTDKYSGTGIVVVRRGGELEWWWAGLSIIYSAQARLILHGEASEVLGYYPNTTHEQRMRILDTHRIAEARKYP
jgi:hypothetical protein